MGSLTEFLSNSVDSIGVTLQNWYSSVLGGIAFLFGNCLLFDGVNDTAVKTSPNVFTGKTKISCGAWYYSTLAQANGEIVGCFNQSTGANGFGLQAAKFGANAFIKVYASDATARLLSTDTAVLLPNQWNFLAYTWDGGGGANNTNIYFNGSLVKTGTIATAALAGNLDCFIGSAVATAQIDGKVDHVGVSYSEIWDQTEITRLYNAGVGDFYKGTCEHIWELDESGSTATAPDTGAVGGLTLTLTNFAFDAGDGWRAH
jgi:hypothetical protein